MDKKLIYRNKLEWLVLFSVFDSPIHLNQLGSKIYDSKKYNVVQFNCMNSNLFIFGPEGRVLMDNGFSSWYKLLLFQKYFGELRSVNFHFVHYLYSFLYFFLFARYRNIIIVTSQWGSDYYDKRNRVGLKARLLNLVYVISNKITISNPKTISEFQESHHSQIGKVKSVKLGLELLEYINKCHKIANEGITFPKDAKIICIGTNKRPIQNHIRVIKSIADTGYFYSKDYLFIFPFISDRNDEYYLSVKKTLDENKLNYQFITEFLSMEDIAKLRLRTDILIQVQDRDQFSNAMQESIYAGAEVITGDWLPYEVFDDKGVRLEKVSNFEEIGNKLIDLIKKGKMSEKELNHRRQMIHEFSSWDSVIEDWLNLYK